MSSILANLKSRFQSVPKWSGRYSWGCKWSASLPVARIFPKPSKGFAKARPSTACDQRWHSRLTAFLAKGVFQIMLVVFPPGIDVQHVVSSAGDSHHLAFHDVLPNHRAYQHSQQDLIGFFNSVPHGRNLQALTFTSHLLQERWGKPWQEQSLQLSFRNKDSAFRVFRGRRRFAAHDTRTMHMEDLPALMPLCCSPASFNVAHSHSNRFREPVWARLWHQCCAHLVASTTKFLWLRNFRNVTFNIGFTMLSFSYRHSSQPLDPATAQFGVLRRSHSA